MQDHLNAHTDANLNAPSAGVSEAFEAEIRHVFDSLPRQIFISAFGNSVLRKLLAGWAALLLAPLVGSSIIGLPLLSPPMTLLTVLAPLVAIFIAFIGYPLHAVWALQSATHSGSSRQLTLALIERGNPSSPATACLFDPTDLSRFRSEAIKFPESWPSFGPSIFIVLLSDQRWTVLGGFLEDSSSSVGTTNLPNGELGVSVSRLLMQEFAASSKRLSEHGPKLKELVAQGQSMWAVSEREGHRDSSPSSSAWDALVLPLETKNRIAHRLQHFLTSKRTTTGGLLLFGPPGTGKSTIAKAVADTFTVYFKATNPADLKGAYIGQSEAQVRTLWNDLRANAPSILFIDECEGVFARRGGTGGDQFDQSIVRCFLSEWDGVGEKGRVFVIGATNRRDMIDDAILSRFSDTIEIPLPDGKARENILANELHSRGVPTALDPAVPELTTGFSGRDLSRVADDVSFSVANGADFQTALSEAIKTRRKARSDATSTKSSWSTLVLPADTKKDLATIVGILKNADTLRARGIDVPANLLLYGPPGTGKSEVARTLANESGLGFIAKTTADLKGAYIGHSAKNVAAAFEAARAASPCILCFDEIDVLVPTRGGSGDAYTQEIVAQLLQELDGIRKTSGIVFLVGITNAPDSIDPAILSRFGKRLEIALPDLGARTALLEILLSDKPFSGDKGSIARFVADRTEGKSGRDLKSILSAAETRAVSRALELGGADGVELLPEDFEAVLK